MKQKMKPKVRPKRKPIPTSIPIKDYIKNEVNSLKKSQVQILLFTQLFQITLPNYLK